MSESTTPLPLEGLRVVDCATLFAGPVIASLLGDYGADVVKVEHPRGDGLRSMGWQKDGVSLWWALVGRNKRCVTLTLSDPRGQELMTQLVADADVLIENFRPGTLERWNLGPDVLHELNPRLVIVRTTGFGQTGPYSHLPGFGTLAESISGFAHINGWPDGPPALPPFALGDGIAALTGCVRGDVRALVARARRRGQGPGDRPLDLRAAVLGARPAGARLRPARDRPGAHRQPRAVHRAAQRLPDEGRTLARPVGERAVDRRARDAASSGGRT